jgi:hypothetical protein
MKAEMSRKSLLWCCEVLFASALVVGGYVLSQRTARASETGCPEPPPGTEYYYCKAYSGSLCTYSLPGVDCVTIPIGMSLCGGQLCAKLLDGPSKHDCCLKSDDPNSKCKTKGDGYCVKYRLGRCFEGEVHCICDVNAVVPPAIGFDGSRTYCAT